MTFDAYFMPANIAKSKSTLPGNGVHSSSASFMPPHYIAVRSFFSARHHSAHDELPLAEPRCTNVHITVAAV